MAESVFPVSFRDPQYAAIDERVTGKLGLPEGLLSSIRENGERTNADRVSSAGARTPYQIIPATREQALKKWGIDAWLSPENAAEVAGLLLKDSLQRNKGDAVTAIAEYHGGTDPANWGAKTKAYVQRVTSVFSAAPAPAAQPRATPAAQPRATPAAQPRATPDGASTFDRAMQQVDAAIPQDTIARVLAAYQGGQMTPAERAEFEADVKTGKVMLPKGASLTPEAAPGAQALPMEVAQAYFDGRMTPQEKAELQNDVKAGRVKLPGGVLMNEQGELNGTPAASLIPGNDKTPVVPPPATLGQKIVGAGEAALATATGMTGGAVGVVAGAAGGLAGAILNGEFGTPEAVRAVEEAAATGADRLTYTPRTAAGQDMAQAVGGAVQSAIPVMPLTGELAALSRAGAAVKPTAQVAATAGADAAKTAATKVTQAAQATRERAVSMTSAATRRMLGVPEEPQAAGAMGSVGAAGTDPAAIRRTTAAGLPVPMELTTGQATRNHQQLRFEGETAKGELGQPLREHAATQNAQLAQNFEALIDSTGARAPSVIETGRAVVDNGLVPAAARAKTKYRVLYQQAEKAGEMEQPVSTAPLVQYLQENASLNQGNLAGGALGLLERELQRLGGVGKDGAPGELSLKNMELLRRQMNNAIDAAPENATNMRAGVEIKGLIDTATEGLGGDVYKQARAARQRYGQLFENNAIVKDLLRNRRGTADRQVALEDVFRRTILNGSREDLSMLRRTLQIAGGEEGHQAWRELQGATLRYMLDEATKGVATDIRGNPIFSAAKLQSAVRALDVDSRLDFVLGKQRAQMVRDLVEIAKDVTTVPPGALNTSNTASVILAAIAEAGATGGLTGLPVPVLSTLRLATKYVRDRAVRQRVMAALGKAEQNRPSAPPRDPSRAPRGRTVH